MSVIPHILVDRLACGRGDPTVSTQAVLCGPIVRRVTLVASYHLQRAPATSSNEYIGTSTGSARSHPTECRGTQTRGARNPLDRWSPLLAKEGI
jgi:hypothetical protein